MSKGSILVAEDDDTLRSLYIKKLGIEGYEVRGAANGELAVAAIKEKEPDMLLCDIQMPKMDGFQILTQFPRESRKFSIIMLTNFADDDSKQRALKLGADAYYVKHTSTLDSLVKMVDGLRHL